MSSDRHIRSRAAFRRLRQENHEFEASLRYTARPYLKTGKQLGVMPHTLNPSTHGAEVGRFLGLRPAWLVYIASFRAARDTE